MIRFPLNPLRLKVASYGKYEIYMIATNRNESIILDFKRNINSTNNLSANFRYYICEAFYLFFSIGLAHNVQTFAMN